MAEGGDYRHFQHNRPSVLTLLRAPYIQERYSFVGDMIRHGVDDHTLVFLNEFFLDMDLYNDHTERNVANEDNVDNHNEVAGPAIDMEVNQQLEEEDPQPGGSRRRSREDDDEDEESSSKLLRWWDEFDDTDSETYSLSDTDADSDSNDENNGAGDDGESSQPEGEDPLPQSLRKRAREEDNEDERGGKQLRHR